MSKKITAQQVRKKLRRISNERGYEYIYERPTYEDEYGGIVEASECYYSGPDGKPSCIVGVLLHDVAPATYRKVHQYEWEEDGYDGPRCASVQALCADSFMYEEATGVNLNDIFEPEAIQALKIAQRKQDDGYSWGEAVDAVAARY